jgi:hypothetical protein
MIDTLWDIGLESTFGQVMSHSLTRFGLVVERLLKFRSMVVNAEELKHGLPDSARPSGAGRNHG